MTENQSVTLEAAMVRLASRLASIGHHSLEAAKELRNAQRQLQRQRGEADATRATTQPSACNVEATDPNANNH
jgi:hypothetical protein